MRRRKPDLSDGCIAVILWLVMVVVIAIINVAILAAAVWVVVQVLKATGVIA